MNRASHGGADRDGADHRRADPGGRGIRPMEAADLHAVAALHRAVFPAYPSSLLGPRFCATLLRRYLDRPDSIVLVYGTATGIDGYLVACPPDAQRAVNECVVPAAACAVWRLLLTRQGRRRVMSSNIVRRARPVVRSRLRTLLRRFRGAADRRGKLPSTDLISGGESRADPAPLVRVVLLGLAPSARGQGVADSLLSRFAEAARRSRHRAAELVVAEANAPARRCYERNGWEPNRGESGTLRYQLLLAR